MKRMAWMAVGIALLLGVSRAGAQSLGDAARAVRKSKGQQNAATHYFDNDNLPKEQHLSVVGPEPAAEAKASVSPAGEAASETKASASPSGDVGKTAQPAQESANATASSPSEAQAPAPVPAPEVKAPAAGSNAGNNAFKDRIHEQRKKVEALSKDLDLTQREYRLRAVAMYSDAGNRLRNSAQWDKDDAQYKKDIADKQRALDSAKQDLKDMEEQARKSGEAVD
jgi:hypothetical protein